MNQKKIVPILFDTYLATVKNSAGSKIFRNCFAFVDRERKDIINNGDLSCAFFVSSILKINNLLPNIHVTVISTEREMIKKEWYKIEKPRIGSVLIWHPAKNGNRHEHIGFYIGKNKAVSNNSKTGYPVTHHWTFGVVNKKLKREIRAIYWNDKLRK